MKNYAFFLLTAGCLLGCQSSSRDITPKVDYDQASIQLMNDLAPQLVGTWSLRKVQIKYQSHNAGQKELKITKDTALYELATLTIVPAATPRTTPRDLRRGEYDGTIQYGSKTYPIQFDLRASPNWLVNHNGDQALFLFQYRFPNGTRIVEREEAFLNNIGLVGDNFALETMTGQRTMVWRSFNNGIERIDFIKQ